MPDYDDFGQEIMLNIHRLLYYNHQTRTNTLR